MPRILTIANKLMSLRGRVQITDEESGAVAYEARAQFALFAPPWRVVDNPDARGDAVAIVRRRLLAWVPTWDVETPAGRFQIRRKLLGLRRRYYAVGGDYDGAVIEGDYWGLRFSVTHGTTQLATAAGHVLSLRDRLTVEIPGAGETFVVIAMLVLQIARRAARSESGD